MVTTQAITILIEVDLIVHIETVLVELQEQLLLHAQQDRQAHLLGYQVLMQTKLQVV